MKLELTVKTPKGFYTGAKTEIGVVSDTSNGLMKIFDKLPDSCNGAKLMDWTELTIVITREPRK